jgi:hypothetical protein
VDDRENLSQPERLRLPSRWNRLEIFTEKMLRCRAASLIRRPITAGETIASAATLQTVTTSKVFKSI